MPRHWPPYHSLYDPFFWSRDHRGRADRIEWIKFTFLFSIDANQIKRFWTLILFLDFDWCPIEVIITLHIIGLCRIILDEMQSFPPKEGMSWKTLISLETCLFHYGAMNILELHHPEIKPPHSMSMKFYFDSLQTSCSSLLSPRSLVLRAKSLRVIQPP